MSTGSVVRKNLNDLSKPIELRELNRQLDWMWKKILGGLTAKDFSDGGMKSIIKTVEKTVAEEITADSVETNILVAALAEMMVAEIGVANISYAQIVDLFSERIFTDAGIAGHFRMENLEVTQAQIVDLIVSSFRLVSQDGKVYKVSVDAEGNLHTEYLEDQEEWMQDGKIPDGYSAVASELTVGDVTSGNLYVSGAADVMKLTAKVLTADQGFINELTSSDIFASYLMANRAFIDLLGTTKIVGEKSLTLIAGDADEAKLTAREIERLSEIEEFPGTFAQCERKEGESVHIFSEIKPQQDLSNGAVTPDNVCPITGWTELNASLSGKNHFSGWIRGKRIRSTRTASDFGEEYDDEKGACTDFIAVPTDVRVRVWGLTNTLMSFVCYYDANKRAIDGSGSDGVSARNCDLIERCRFIRISINENSQLQNAGKIADLSDDVQVEIGTKSTDYEPYNGSMCSIRFDETIYGGFIDWNSGLMTVTHGSIVADGSNDEKWKKSATQNAAVQFGKVRYDATFADAKKSTTIWCQSSHYTHHGAANTDGIWLLSTQTSGVAPRIISSAQTVDEFKAILAADPVLIVYKLAEPYTIKLSPQRMSTVDGLNIVYTNADDGRIEFGHNPLVDAVESIETAQLLLEGSHVALKTRQDNVESYLTYDNGVVRVGKTGETSEYLIDPWGAGVSINDKVFSRFEASRILLGGMEIREPSVGGLAFDSIADTLNGGE